LSVSFEDKEGNQAPTKRRNNNEILPTCIGIVDEWLLLTQVQVKSGREMMKAMAEDASTPI